MDVQKKLDEIVAIVGSARSMPMSASCVVNRAELLAGLEELRAALPGSLAQAQELLGGREQMVQEARAEADRIIESARAHRGSLISDTEVARRSQDEADRILAEARREAEEIRAEADDYVDSKLANFEVVLTKTIGSVDRGREKLLGRAPGGHGPAYGEGEDPDAPERSADPETLRQRADAYVDAKFGAFEAVLTKTLEAVGRGRLKLQGARPTDELGAHLAAQDGSQPPRHTGDAEFLAGLADPGPGPGGEQQTPDPYAEPAYQPMASAPGAPAATGDAYSYQQDTYGQQGAYAQHDTYAQQDPYGQQDPYAYGWQQPQQHSSPGYGPDGAGHPAPPAQPSSPAQTPSHAPHAPDTSRTPHRTPAAALDETSLFDTSMIDLDTLRRYEEGRQ
ncbi:cell division initiation protein [Streptomyces sp. MST-110588]|uniref:cell division initiation protein n=1 Tax=Streptomyces sp. MST-110588 TaxID=2833628 RepID=UPI001F5CC829|nr:cell division initiation protein [Streptomyces sp. MST-110588]UNO39728.1 cell division initiation protein [Streptomyces sp. MST-110588]